MSFVGLDVSVRDTRICIVDEAGHVVREGTAESSPEAIAAFLAEPKRSYHLVSLEAGPLCQWLYAGLSRFGLPVVCVEGRHAKQILSGIRTNKTDRNDARGLAEMMRMGIYKPVHMKTRGSLYITLLLGARSNVLLKLVDVENSIRGLLLNFGLKLGRVPRLRYRDRVLEIIRGVSGVGPVIRSMLAVRKVLYQQFMTLDKRVRQFASKDEICRLLMTAPGVGPFVALAYRAAIDEPSRFKNSRSVGAYLGLTPRIHQSGDIFKYGKTQYRPRSDVRFALQRAAVAFMYKTKKPSALRAWAVQLLKRRGAPRALLAVARRLAVILHRMWVDRTEFRWE